MNETLIVIIEAVIKSLILTIGLLTGFAYTTLLERRFIALIQVRYGPNRVGPSGLLQPVADAVKAFLKEELTPENADKVMFTLAPIITVVPALVILGTTPFGPTVEMFGREVRMAVSDINVGVLYFLSVASVAVYGIVLAGWSSDNKYALMGGLRSTAQMISYELALGLSIVPPIMLAGSLSLLDIVEAQQNSAWFIILQPIGGLIFYIASLAEVNRAPFDMPEAEQELTAGYHTEYSGMKFALFFMAEYIKMAAVSAIFATLYLGGYLGPFVGQFPWLGPIYMVVKIFLLLVLMVWIRGTLPRLRYDQLMDFGWKLMLPVALANVAVTAVVLVLWGS